MARIIALAILPLLLFSCGSPRLLTVKGNAALRQGKLTDAVADYAAASRILDQPRWNESRERLAPWLRYNIGTAYHLLGEKSGAEKEYLEIGQDSAAVVRWHGSYNYGILLYEKGDFAGAEREFRTALTLKPDDTEAKINLELAARNRKAAEEKARAAPAPGEGQPLTTDRAENLLSRIRAAQTIVPPSTAAPDGEQAEADW